MMKKIKKIWFLNWAWFSISKCSHGYGQANAYIIFETFNGEASILGPVYIIPFSYENGMEILSYENGIV